MALSRTKMDNSKKSKIGSDANIGFKAQFFLAADNLRGNMDTAEYEHLVLVFVKYVSDTFAAPSDLRQIALPDAEILIGETN